MTDNMDEFDQDDFDLMDDPDFDEAKPAKGKNALLDAWRNKPIVKLFVIMGVVVFAMAGALGAFSSDETQDNRSRFADAPNVNEVPGGKASPFFIEQNKQANKQRVSEAMQAGGSAMPTPVGSNVDLSELTGKDKKDPLLEFRAETERLKRELRAEQKQSDQRVQILQQQIQQKQVVKRDDSLAKAMQKQMQELMESWKPTNMKTVDGVVDMEAEALAAAQQTQMAMNASSTSNESQTAESKAKMLIAPGVVNYVQLLTEANSDVPGPIMAQILSGPLAGGRAIGSFQTMSDYLVMTFNSISYKGKVYSINALALDPDTTLGGMATEVDHRYMTRLLLPAAASFLSAFGDALGDTDSETTVSGDSVIVSSAEKGYKDGLYSGLGEMGNTMAQFFQNEANQTKTLVRVGVGTPMGLFFLSPVMSETVEEKTESTTGLSSADLKALLAKSYNQGAQDSAQSTDIYPDATGARRLNNSGVTYLDSTEQYKAGTTTIYKK